MERLQNTWTLTLWCFIMRLGLSWGLTITQNSIRTISDLDRSHLSDTRSAENDRIGADTDPEYRIDASLSKIQQNKTTDTYSTSQGPIKREGEREGQQEHKSHSFIQSRMSKKKHCQASMVEGLAPPTRAVVHSHDTICRRLRIQYVFLHMCGVNQFWIIVFFTAVKPANNILFCIELIQSNTSDQLIQYKLIQTNTSDQSQCHGPSRKESTWKD